MITLTKAEAIPLILQALENNQLSAQNPVKNNIGCFYKHPKTGCSCAIGVLIPDGHDIKYSPVFNSMTIRHLEMRDLVSFPVPEDLKWFCVLQTLHDDWQTLTETEDRAVAAAAFIAHLKG